MGQLRRFFALLLERLEERRHERLFLLLRAQRRDGRH
jgi:hypothetical protein